MSIKIEEKDIIHEIKSIITESRDKAVRAIDHERTLMYWNIGRKIFEEEQQGKDRANYGEYLTKYIAEALEPAFGSGFSRRQLELSRQFYRTYPIANALHSQLSWTHYKKCSSVSKVLIKETSMFQSQSKTTGLIVSLKDKSTVVFSRDCC